MPTILTKIQDPIPSNTTVQQDHLTRLKDNKDSLLPALTRRAKDLLLNTVPRLLQVQWELQVLKVFLTSVVKDRLTNMVLLHLDLLAPTLNLLHLNTVPLLLELKGSPPSVVSHLDFSMVLLLLV